MIIWLASYPKSGNTWVRSFLTTVLYSVDGENSFEHLYKIKQFPLSTQLNNYIDDYKDMGQLARSWLIAQQAINLDGKIKLFKTHHVNCKIDNQPFTDLDNTLGVVHIVRDPRNVVTSIKNHYSLPNIKAAKNFLLDDNMWIQRPEKERDQNDGRVVPTLISSWKTNYQSWKNKSKNYLLIRYEDLVNNPFESFKKICEYISKLMDIEIKDEKIEKAILTNSFEKLKKLEEMGKFDEYKVRLKTEKEFKFFNLGPNNSWEKILDKETIDDIQNSFSIEMKELNYV